MDLNTFVAALLKELEWRVNMTSEPLVVEALNDVIAAIESAQSAEAQE